MKEPGKVVIDDYTKYFVASGFFHNLLCIRMPGSVSVKFCLFFLVVTSIHVVFPGWRDMTLPTSVLALH